MYLSVRNLNEFSLVTVIISMYFLLIAIVSPMEHRLKIIYHHQLLNDTEMAHRVRREMKNQSPYFEEFLYIASVTEEKPAGAVVITLRAKDPENSPITYAMTSLLDSRSQVSAKSLFVIVLCILSLLLERIMTFTLTSEHVFHRRDFRNRDDADEIRQRIGGRSLLQSRRYGRQFPSENRNDHSPSECD